MQLKKTVVLLFVFCVFGTVFAQDTLFKKSSNRKTKIKTEKDFKETLLIFDTLVNKKGANNSFWEEQLLQRFTEAKNWAVANGTQEDILQAKFMCLMYYDNYLQDEEVLKLAEELIATPKFLSTKNAVYTYQALYNSYERLGYNRQQLEILDDLIALNEKYNYPVRPKTYENYYDLGKIYFSLKQFELARENFRKQARIFKDSDDFIRSASMQNNIALTFKEQQESDSALYYFNLAVKKLEKQTKEDAFFTKSYRQHFKNVILSNIANVNVSLGKLANAEEAFKAEIASSKEVKEPRITRESYHKLAKYYYFKEDFKNAFAYNDSTFLFEKKYSSPTTKVNALLLQSKLYIEASRNKEAIKVLDEMFQIKDSLMKVKAEKVYTEATAKYNYIEAQNKLNKNVEILQQKEKTNQVLWAFMLGSVLAISIILFLFNKTKKSKVLIGKQKKELSKGLIEKQNLLDEMHHRTKNNLQIVAGILELQSQKSKSDEASKLFEESKYYLESISLIHRMLYENKDVENIDLNLYINQLARLMIGSHPFKNIQFSIDCSPVFLHVNTVTSLGLIVCELFTNSLKHAFHEKGSITMHYAVQNNKHHFVYTDNGKNFAIESFTKSKGMGIKLIHSLAEDLEGKIEFDNKNGFYFELKFTE